MKPQLFLLLLLAACQSGGGNSDVTQNILHCENYGAISESTTTNEATDELETGTGETGVSESDFQQSEPNQTTPASSGIQPAVPGIGIGTSKSAISEPDASECEANGLCAIVGMVGSKVVVEHCSNISFPEGER